MKVKLVYSVTQFEEVLNEMECLGYDLISWKMISLVSIVAIFRLRKLA